MIGRADIKCIKNNTSITVFACKDIIVMDMIKIVYCNVYRPVTERVHDTLPHLVPEQPPAHHGHREVDRAQNCGCGVNIS